MKISILGTGWLGAALFTALLAQKKYVVYGSSRKQAVRNRLLNLAAAKDYQSSQLDIISAMQSDPPPHRMFAITSPHFRQEEAAFFKVNTLVITLPPGGKRENAIEAYTTEIKAIVTQAENAGVQHLIYTSSTGVYGNQTGEMVEAAPLQPSSSSAKAVVAAEAIIATSKIPATVLRLAGLYGPDRHPGRWFAGKEDLPNGDGPVNLVHQSDVVQAILRSISAGPPPAGIDHFNICAASHPPKKDFYPAAIQDYGGESGNWLAGGAAEKRIDSSKARGQLNWQPTFDDLSGY